MKPHIIAVLAICLVLPACLENETRWGGSSGVKALQDEVPFQICYNLQGATYVGAFDRATAEPQFLILWKARRKGESGSDMNNRITQIHGHKIKVSFTEKAVYALQGDYTLKRLTLTNDETNHILNLFSADEPFKFDPIWDKAINPNLIEIEDPTWNPPPWPKQQQK